MRYQDRVACILDKVFMNKLGRSDISCCVLIAELCGMPPVGRGKSTYARRRRAKEIGRCHRCFRVFPGFYYTTRCDNKTCVPGLSSREDVANYIRWGVTEVIPHSGS